MSTSRRRAAPLVLAALAGLALLAACGGSTAPATAFPSLGPDAVVFQAKGQQFLTTTVHVPAEKAWTLALDNQDALPHNVVILDRSDKAVFTSTVFTGASLKVEPAPALAAGDYRFICAVHPEMKGTLTVP
jgi:plastocyanin